MGDPLPLDETVASNVPEPSSLPTIDGSRTPDPVETLATPAPASWRDAGGAFRRGIHHRIGDRAGRDGSVLQAEDRRLGRTVAMKVIHQHRRIHESMGA